jgi:hypothetical protein
MERVLRAHDDKEKRMSRDTKIELTCLLFLIVCILTLAITFGCAKPTVSEFLGNGVDCKAAITVPEELPERGETVTVDVKIFNCREIQSQTKEDR